MVPTPLSNGQSNGVDPSGAPTTFDTMVYPEQDRIEIPPEFVVDWKDSIAVQNVGSIKDPAGNFFGIYTRTILSDMFIRGGRIIARYCGFNEPQKVILDYKVNDNQFNMRIVDGEGNDVPYFGFHYPENIHAKILANPNLQVNPRYVDVIGPPDGGLFLPFEFAMLWMEELNGVNDDSLIQFLQLSDEHNETSESDEDVPAFDFQWTLDVTRPVAKGRSDLYFPKSVVNHIPFVADQNIVLVDDNTNERFPCKVSMDTTSEEAIYIGSGWYECAKSLRLKTGDMLFFGLDNPPMELNVRVLRRMSH